MTFSTEMLRPRNPPDRETQIPRYKFKLNQNLNLNLYCEIPRNLSFLIWWLSGVQHFQWNLSYVPDLILFLILSRIFLGTG